MDNIKEKDVSELDLDNMFLHYTSIKNLKSISKKGLLPKVGENSKGIEKNKKIFFSEGIEASLIIMDIWINWLILKPKNKYIYRLGAFFLEKKILPSNIYVWLFNKWRNNDNKLKYACKKLDDILNKSVYLVLDLEKGKDFDYQDIDEVKDSNFPQNVLEYFYDNRSTLNNKNIEKWNMHTFINKSINPSKIKILKYNNDCSAKQVVMYFIENKYDFVKENCKLLHTYYQLYK